MRRRASSLPVTTTDRPSLASNATTAIDSSQGSSVRSIGAGRPRFPTTPPSNIDEWEKLREIVIPGVVGRTIKIDIHVLVDQIRHGGDINGDGMTWRSVTWNEEECGGENDGQDDGEVDVDEKSIEDRTTRWAFINGVAATMSVIWLLVVAVVTIVGVVMIGADLLGRGLEVLVPFEKVGKV